jgi:hypothetical protein
MSGALAPPDDLDGELVFKPMALDDLVAALDRALPTTSR